MKTNYILPKYLDEETAGLESGGLPEGPAVDDGAVPEQTPEYMVGEYTADDVVNQLNYTKELPNQLRGFESRISALVTPLLENMQEIQNNFAKEPGFNPKLEKLAEALKGYDENLANALLPALQEDLTNSFNYTPLDNQTLETMIGPILQQQRQNEMLNLVPALLANLSFDPETVVNRDAENNVLDPATDLQKDFQTWWEQQDASTQQALSTYDIGYARAMHRFANWRAERLKGKGEAAGAASARLKGAAQKPTSGARQQTSRQLTTEEDGYRAYLASKRS